MSESTGAGIAQVRDVDPATLTVLRERARSLGQSLSGYLRDLMDADAATETNAEVIALAEALGCELLTGDVKLRNATGHHATVITTR
jgi:predicted nucleic acid-binding protein